MVDIDEEVSEVKDLAHFLSERFVLLKLIAVDQSFSILVEFC